MKKTIISLVAIVLMTDITPVLASDSVTNTELHQRLNELVQHNKKLTERIRKLEQIIEKQGVEDEPAEEASFLKTITDNVELSGLVEVEANYSKNKIDDSDNSDVILATVEIGLDSKLSDWSSAHLLLLYEEGEEDNDIFLIDEGTVTLGNLERFPLYLSAGKMYVPFGCFKTHMIMDPLTLEIGETNDSVVQLGLEAAGFLGSFYAYNGDINKKGKSDDHINNFGANAGFILENNDMGINVGFDWINNIGDTDSLGDHLGDRNVDDYVGGISFHTAFVMGPFSIIGEYVGALDDFKADEISFDSKGAQPAAYNIEAGYTTEFLNREITFALGYQATEEAYDLGLYNKLYIATVSMGLFSNTNLAVEYFLAEDYDKSDGGTGENVNSATMQLAVEF